MHTIHIDQFTITYYLRESHRARRLQLCMKNNQLEVVVPKGIGANRVHEFVKANQQWIKNQHLNYNKNANLFWPRQLVQGAQIPFEGGWRSLEVKFALKAWVEITPTAIEIGFNPNDLKQSTETYLKKTLIAHLMKLAQEKVDLLLPEVCNQIKRWPRQIKVKTQKSRWGSCGIHEDIYINWLLILAPPIVLKYVVVHECCHLFYRSHGVRFWQKVASVMPEYLQAERWLSQYGRFLTPPYETLEVG